MRPTLEAGGHGQLGGGAPLGAQALAHGGLLRLGQGEQGQGVAPLHGGGALGCDLLGGRLPGGRAPP